MAPPLILASTSRIRRDLLTRAGLDFTAEAPGLDERALEAGFASTTTPADVATRLAIAKAAAVSARAPDAMVIGADQTLALADRRFSKPADRSAARTQLQALRGATHTLHAAVALVRAGTPLWHHVEPAHLTMRAFDDTFLDSYLDRMGDRVTTTVGGYELEGLGVQLFSRVEGDFFTVLGLPLLPLLAALRTHGALAP